MAARHARSTVQSLAMLIAALAMGCAQTGSITREQQTSYVQHGTVKLRVFVDGSGPAMVLLPGQGRGPRDYEEIVKPLVTAGYRVIRPEPRGFGESVGPLDGVSLRDNADDIAATIEQLGAAPAIVVGMAYGNRVARMLAATKPSLVRGVVLIAAGGKFPPKAGVMNTLQVAQDKSQPLEKRAAAARTVLYGPGSTISVADMRLDDVSADTIKAQSLTPALSGPIDAWWDGGNVPMLVVQGLNDVIAPPENGRSLKQAHPQRVTLIELHGLGHRMMQERPDLVVDALVGWAKKLD